MPQWGSPRPLTLEPHLLTVLWSCCHRLLLFAEHAHSILDGVNPGWLRIALLVRWADPALLTGVFLHLPLTCSPPTPQRQGFQASRCLVKTPGREQDSQEETRVPRGAGGSRHVSVIWEAGLLSDIRVESKFWVITQQGRNGSLYQGSSLLQVTCPREKF